MADAITWKYVSKEQVDRLADHHAVDDCRRELAQVFKIDLEDKKQCFLLDCHVHNYSFCRQAYLHPEQISVLLGILQLLMEKDFAGDSQTTMEQSYQAFQKLLLDHSVERSPKSVQLFSSNEVTAIVDFVTNTYFRHFHLYKCVFTPFYHTHVVQKPMNDVQLPPAPRPLSEAFMHIVRELKIETESSPTPVEA